MIPKLVFLLFDLGIGVSFADPGARLLRQPDLSTEAVVFVHGGDLWSAPRGGGQAHRLTQTDDAEEFPKFSPDGRWIAFTRSGSVYVMLSSGGEELRLTWRPGWNQVLGWTPDGKNVLIHSDRLKGSVTSNPHLFLVPQQGGWPSPLPMPRATHGSFSADGEKIAYGPNPEIVLWTPFRHYRGGAQGYIAIYDLTTDNYFELPRTNANDVFPMWHGQAI
jgi:tricorn protease